MGSTIYSLPYVISCVSEDPIQMARFCHRYHIYVGQGSGVYIGVIGTNLLLGILYHM